MPCLWPIDLRKTILVGGLVGVCLHDLIKYRVVNYKQTAHRALSILQLWYTRNQLRSAYLNISLDETEKLVTDMLTPEILSAGVENMQVL